MKKVLLIISTILLLASLALGVSAHSGRTDGEGGHYDRSTGEYHYHHGYPAHDHYDMDGDGDLDCPYEFEAKTDHSPVTESNSNSYADLEIPSFPTIDFDYDFPPLPEVATPIRTTEPSNTKSSSGSNDTIGYGIMFGGLAVVGIVFAFVKRK